VQSAHEEEKPDACLNKAKDAQAIFNEEDCPDCEGHAFAMMAAAQFAQEKYDKAVHAAKAARRLFKDSYDSVQEVAMLNMAGQSSIQRLSKSGDKSGANAWAEVQKGAKEALKLAREVEDRGCVAFALVNLVQALEALGRYDEAVESAWEAVSLYRETGSTREETTALLLTCRVLMGTGRMHEVLEPANDALHLAQQLGDAQYEEMAQQIVTDVEAAIKPQNAFPMMTPEMMAMMAQQQQQPQGGGGGAPVVPIWMQNQGGGGADVGHAPESQVQKARSRGEALDVKSGGVDPTVIKSKIQGIAAQVMGIDDVSELEMDAPFMESGLTSASSVVLRDELSAELTGVNLPITLVFDYPNISSVAEFICEKMGK